MSKPKLGDVTIKRDVRIHSNLLHASCCLLKQGQSVEAGSFHQFMASLVFTAFALEAYLNWLGGQLFPHWNFLERLPPKDKLTVICQKLEINFDYGSRPAQT